METELLVQLIGAGWGLLTSVGFKIIKPLDNWLYSLPDDRRGYVFALLSLLVPLGILGVSCVGLYALVPCTTDIWKDLFRGWVSFIVLNIGTFIITPDSRASKAKSAKKLRDAVIVAKAYTATQIDNNEAKNEQETK